MNLNEKILYIIAGANGSGKSTLASVLLQEKNLDFLNADEIAKLYRQTQLTECLLLLARNISKNYSTFSMKKNHLRLKPRFQEKIF